MFDSELMKAAAARTAQTSCDQSIGASTKSALFSASTADEGGEEAPARIGSPMRGWQWKVLQKEQELARQKWMPRMVRSEATPLTELLASPGKQSVLGALGGGLLGGGLGLAASQFLPPGLIPDQEILPAALTGGGAGLGALMGASSAYGRRRRENDRVSDALRRTPPGATLRDYEALQKADAAQQ